MRIRLGIQLVYQTALAVATLLLAVPACRAQGLPIPSPDDIEERQMSTAAINIVTAFRLNDDAIYVISVGRPLSLGEFVTDDLDAASPTTFVLLLQRGQAISIALHPSSLVNQPGPFGSAPILLYLRLPGGSIRKTDQIQVLVHGVNSHTNRHYCHIENPAPTPDLPIGTLLPPVDVPKLSPSPAYASVEGSGNQPVLRLNLNYDTQSVTNSLFGWSPMRTDTTYLRSHNTLSTQAGDGATQLELAIGYHKDSPVTGTASRVLQYLSTNAEVQALANQNTIVRNRPANSSLNLRLGYQSLLTWPRVNWPSIVQAGIPPTVTLTPYYQHRMQIDKALTPNHTAANLLVLGTEVHWTPIVLGRRTSYDAQRDIFLDLDGSGWWLPDERSTGGSKASHLEGAYTATLRIPIRKFVFQFLSIAYSHGANEANGFAYDTSISATLDVLGYNVKL